MRMMHSGGWAPVAAHESVPAGVRLPQLKEMMQMRSLPAIAALTLFAGLGHTASAQLLAPPAEAPAAAPLFGNAAIRFDRTQHDFGRILDDENVDTTFSFTNTGDTTLEILDHRATCGCTVPEISKRSLLPGESASIKVVFHPAHKKGTQHQTVTLMTNAPDQQQVQLTINAEVRQTTWTDQPVSHFSRIEKGDTRTLAVDVYSRVPNFKIDSIALSNEVAFQAKLGEPVEVPGDSEGEKLRKQTITVSLATTSPIGNFTETLVIRTNDPRKPVIQQQVIAEVIGDLIANPNRVSLGIVRPGDPLKAEFKIVSRASKPFKILTAKAVPAQTGSTLDVEVLPADAATPTEIKIVVTGNAPNVVQPIRGRIELTTDSKDQPKIEVPFYATVRGGSR